MCDWQDITKIHDQVLMKNSRALFE